MSTKQDKISTFNPNNAGLTDSQIFGLPFNEEESDLVLLPVPWEVTVSYGSGASAGPDHIFDASFQVDLFHPEFPDLWKRGIALLVCWCLIHRFVCAWGYDSAWRWVCSAIAACRWCYG
jgi:hypothetical protein